MEEFELKNLVNFTPLPDAPVDSDLGHVNRAGKDYNFPFSGLIKIADVISDLLNSSATKAASAESANALYRKGIWQNRADGLIFSFVSTWGIVRDGNDLTITIPSGKVIDVNNSMQIQIDSIGATEIPNGGGITIEITEDSAEWGFVNDASTIVEGANPDLFIVAKNLNGILKSRIPSLHDSFYAEKTVVTDLSWDFDTSTVDADPGTGEFRLDNATPASVTNIYISKTSQQGIDVGGVLLGLGSGSSVQIIQKTDPLRYIIVTIGDPVDATDYVKLPVTTVDDSGLIFQTGTEGMTTLFYENTDSVSDITRNNINPVVAASTLTLDFAGKNEVYATKSGGGEIIVNENITLSFSNTTNATRAYAFLDVTTATRDIIIDANTISSDTRWVVASTKLVLPVAKYLLIFDFDGSKKILKILPDNAVNITGDQTIYDVKTFDESPILLTFPGVYFDNYSTLVWKGDTGQIALNTLKKQNIVASSSSVTIDASYWFNDYFISALAANVTFNAPINTPINGNTLTIRIKDDGTARTITWNAAFRALRKPLPTTTVVGETILLEFTYNTADNKWDYDEFNPISLYTQTSVTSSATPTPTGNNRENEYYLTALAEAATFAVPSGTPANGDTLIIRIKDNGTARALAFNAIYRVIGETLPTITVIGKTIYIGCIYNSADSKWDVVAVKQEV